MKLFGIKRGEGRFTLVKKAAKQAQLYKGSGSDFYHWSSFSYIHKDGWHLKDVRPKKCGHMCAPHADSNVSPLCCTCGKEINKCRICKLR